MSKRQQILILRQELDRTRTLYEAAVATTGLLQAQLVALANREPPAADVIKAVMAGFKAVMSPDLPPAEPPPDLFGLGDAPDMQGRADPAWEIPELRPDGYDEALQRELLEDDA